MPRTERVLSWLLTAAAIVIAVAVVRREITPGRAATRDESGQRVELLADWQTRLGIARSTGSFDAPVRITEFTDLECPACRRFHAVVLPEVMREFGTNVSISLVHFPLPMHREALAAARASECAAMQGRFGEFVEAVFAKQETLGRAPLSTFATAAGVRDLKIFDGCVSDTTRTPGVGSGLALAAELGLNATPTIFINGWRFRQTPSAADLTMAIRNVQAGREPLDGYVPGQRGR